MNKKRPSEPHIEISAARTSELDDVLRLLCAAFQMPFEAARDIFYGDPYFDRENKRVLRVGGEVVSCLTVLPADMWIGESVVRVAGIAGVATQVSHQRKGYAGQLLTDTLQTLARQGYSLALLHPFSTGYYERFGFRFVSEVRRVRVPCATLPIAEEAANVRLTLLEDIPTLTAMYRETSRGKTLRCLRDEKRWRYVLDHVRLRVVYASEGQSPQGWMLYDYRKGAVTQIAPLTTEPPILRVIEIVALTEEAQRGLLAHLALQKEAETLEYDVAPDDRGAGGLLATATGRELAKSETWPMMMACILRPGTLMEALRPNWKGFSGQIVLGFREPLLNQKVTCLLLTGDGKREPSLREITPSEASLVAMRLEATSEVWSPVVMGYHSGEDAALLGELKASNPAAVEAAAFLFPPRFPYLPVPDHF